MAEEKKKTTTKAKTKGKTKPKTKNASIARATCHMERKSALPVAGDRDLGV